MNIIRLPSISSPALNTPRYTPSSLYSNNHSSDSINTTTSTNAPSNVSTPHTSVSSSLSVNRRRIRFADEPESYSKEAEQPARNSSKENLPSILVTSPSIASLAKPKIKPPHIQERNQVQNHVQIQTPSQNLYPSHRHLDAKQKSLSLLKLLSSTSISEWTAIDDEPERTYLKSIDGLAMPIFRREKLVTSGWTVEQLCTVVQNFGARKICKCISQQYIYIWLYRGNGTRRRILIIR